MYNQDSSQKVPSLNTLIDHCQAHFPGESIAENVLLEQDIVKNYHKEKGHTTFALTMDIMKANDSVEWLFYSILA